MGAEQFRMSEGQTAKDEGERAIPQSQVSIPNSQVALELPRINGTPEEVEQGLAKLVLSLVEFLRQVLERQAVRRMDAGDLSDDDIERMGLTLMRLEEKVVEMADQFGLSPEELNLDLGPVGKLL
jgi:Gas vesicle protein K